MDLYGNQRIFFILVLFPGLPDSRDIFFHSKIYIFHHRLHLHKQKVHNWLYILINDIKNRHFSNNVRKQVHLHFNSHLFIVFHLQKKFKNLQIDPNNH